MHIHPTPRRRLPLGRALAALLALAIALALFAGLRPHTAAAAGAITGTQFGINSIDPPIKSTDSQAPFDPAFNDKNIANAAALKVAWDRWPAQWYWLEQPWGSNQGIFLWNGTLALTGDQFDLKTAVTKSHSMLSLVPAINTLVELNGVPRRYDCASPLATVPAGHDNLEYNTECPIAQTPHNPRIEGLFLAAPTAATGPNGNYWGDYVNWVTTQLKAYGITTFETWNEPDLQWRDPGTTDPEMQANPPTDTAPYMNDYVQMVRTTLASAATGSQIILGAPTSPGGNPVVEAWGRATWTAVNQANLAPGLRAVAIHSYEWPFRTWQLADQVRAAFTTRADIPVWVTESGLHYVDGQELDYNTRHASYVFEEAAYARVANVEVDIHYGMRDKQQLTGQKNPQLGLTDDAGNLLPAANSLRTAVKYLSSAQLDTTPGANIMPANSQTASFQSFVTGQPYTRLSFNDTANNRHVTLVWANGTSAAQAQIAAQPGSMCATLYDQQGNDRTSTDLRTAGGQYNITLPPADASKANTAQGFPLVGGPGYALVEAPCTTPTAGILDVIFAIDTTGSMGSAIAGARSAAIQIVNSLAAGGADYRVALVDYKDKSYDPYASRLDLAFTTDPLAFAGAVNTLSAGGGGDTPEDVYSGLMTAIGQPWRNGVKKAIILMGDAGPHDPELVTGYTAGSVIAAANAVDPAAIYPIRIGSDPYMRSIFQELADGTGGRTFDTDYNVSNVSTALLDAIQSVVHAPTAVIGHNNDAMFGFAGTPLSFDASSSFDTDGSIVNYEWDFNNDGLFDVSSNDPVVQYTYPAPYIGPVTLRVTDNDGNTGSVRANVIVTVGSADTTPPVITIASPLAQPYLHTASLNVAWSALDSGGSGLASTGATLDGSPVANGDSVDLFFLSLGQHTLTVTASDQAGNTATASVSFSIVANADSLIAMEQRACALGWIDGNGVCNSLLAKLQAAKSSIDHGKSGTARNQLNAFVNELDAQNGKKVTQGFEILKADTLYVIAGLP